MKGGERFTATQTGATMGTLMYMSPEQVRDSKRVDRRKLVPFSAQAMPKVETVADDKTLADNIIVEKATSREPSKPKPEQPAVASPRNPRKADAQSPVPNTRKRTIPLWAWIVGGVVMMSVIVVGAFVFHEPKTSMLQAVNGDYIVSVGDVTFTMKPVEGGTFTMGATPEQGSDCWDSEKPAHSMTVSDFWIGETEVTQALWKAVMGSNPSYSEGDNLPVENVSRKDCQKFIRKLNTMTGQTFRLPTEAEWEYAARGGKNHSDYKYSGSNNIDEVAWYTTNTNDVGTKPVKGKKPNALGLYDMSGNVWEWCADWDGNYNASFQTNPQGPSSGSRRVLRGGSWHYYARSCRVADRYSNFPGRRDSYDGFRLVLVRR